MLCYYLPRAGCRRPHLIMQVLTYRFLRPNLGTGTSLRRRRLPQRPHRFKHFHPPCSLEIAEYLTNWYVAW